MVDEEQGRPQGSSWRRWVAATGAGDADPSPAAAGDDLDVRLDWPATEDPATVRPVRPLPPVEDDVADALDHDDDGSGDGPRDGSAPSAPDPLGTEVMPIVPLLPAIAGRVDALDGQLRALGMRLDVLAASVGAVRSAIGDRIDGYADAAAASARAADHSLEEQRRSTERAIVELRRGVTGSDEVLRRLSARLEEIATDLASLLDGRSAIAAPPPAAPPADGGPGTAAVLAAVEALAARLDADPAPPADPGPGTAAVLAAVEALAGRLDTGPTPLADPGLDARIAAILDAVAAIDDRLADGAAAEPAPAADAALGERLDAIAALVADPPADPNAAVLLDAVAAVEERLAAVEQQLAAAAEATPAPPPPPAAPKVDRAALAEITQGLADVRALVELVVDTMPGSDEGSGGDVADRVADAVLARLDVDALAKQVADRLEQRFELIVEPGEA